MYAKILKKSNQNNSDQINDLDLKKDEMKRKCTVLILQKDINNFELKTTRKKLSKNSE